MKRRAPAQMRIDMMGPPGVGKTTTLRTMMRSGEREWLARAEASREMFGLDICPASGVMTELVDGAAARLNRFGLRRLSRERSWARYLAWCDALITMRAFPGWFLPAARRLARHSALVELHGVSAPVLYDESVSQRGVMFELRSGSQVSAAISDYYWWVPPPQVVVWFRATPSDVVARVRSRQRLAGPHRGLRDEDLAAQVIWMSDAYERAASTLSRRGSDIVEVDSNESAAEISHALRRELSRLVRKMQH